MFYKDEPSLPSQLSKIGHEYMHKLSPPTCLLVFLFLHPTPYTVLAEWNGCELPSAFCTFHWLKLHQWIEKPPCLPMFLGRIMIFKKFNENLHEICLRKTPQYYKLFTGNIFNSIIKELVTRCLLP